MRIDQNLEDTLIYFRRQIGSHMMYVIWWSLILTFITAYIKAEISFLPGIIFFYAILKLIRNIWKWGYKQAIVDALLKQQEGENQYEPNREYGGRD